MDKNTRIYKNLDIKFYFKALIKKPKHIVCFQMLTNGVNILGKNDDESILL